MQEIVIPKEKAVFWLDRHGCWRNRHGRFERPAIIAKFHKAIERDARGYYLAQTNGDLREKVYFHHEDTALFVFGVKIDGEQVTLRLNTGRTLPMDPAALFIEGDALYTEVDGERIRFADRGLIQISRLMEDDGHTCYLRLGNTRAAIDERQPAVTTPSANALPGGG